MQKESQSSILFRHWLRRYPMKMSCTFEMKDSRGTNSIPFSEIKQVQIDWGLAVNSKKGTLIRTQAVAEGMPDYCYFYNAPAYFVLKYPKVICIIGAGTMEFEKHKTKRKSLTSERAREISIKNIELKKATLSSGSSLTGV